MADAQSLFKANYKVYISTLKSVSYDEHNSVFLCNDESVDVYDFDSLVKKLYPLKQPSSYDALLIDENRIFCIEFKNEKYAEINNRIVRKKLLNGKEIITAIFKKHNIRIEEYTFVYCVAYKNSEARWHRGISKNTVQFGLEKFKPTYFDEIFTNDIQFFTNEYKKYFHNELVC
ncbi:MAG: hypothetical protein Q9M34_08515 [Sulfurimonas sp.]|nr:hypothetical protein [Sulfurimonas sp.]